MLRMDTARLRVALEQLQQATHDHAEWQQKLLRAIVGGLPSDPDDCLVDGARVTCNFDRWYYERAPAELWGQPAFVALGMEHEHLHRTADGLLRAMSAEVPVVQRAGPMKFGASTVLTFPIAPFFTRSLAQLLIGIDRCWVPTCVTRL